MSSLAAPANSGQSKEAELPSQVSVYSKYKLANIKSDDRSLNTRDAQESREFDGELIWNDKTFKEAIKPFLGRGIKSFRDTCREVWHRPNRVCQSHPHHFYLEIINDTGLVGLVLILVGGVILFFNNFKKFVKKNKKIKEIYKLTFYACFFALLMEFFPFRSQGSFFSSTSASYIFFLTGILLGLNDLKIKKR